MPTNNFKAFGIGTGSNVTSQSEYEALQALLNGFQAGKASSAQINKALRQGTVMASILAQFIADAGSYDVLDNGDTVTLLANLKASLLTASPGRFLSVKTFTSSGTYTPTPGTNSVIVELVGASGGSGGTTDPTSSTSTACTSSSSQGTYAMARYNNPVITAVTIGSGGAAGVAGVSGRAGDGGASNFGILLTCPGGQGSWSTTPSGAAITSSVGNASAAPTGTGIISSVFGRISANAVQSSIGVATNFTPSPQGPMPGTMWGASVSGVYRAISLPASNGANGLSGGCRIWEYA